VRVIGADITRAMLLQAQARAARDGRGSAIDLVECTAEAIPFPDAAFDAVIFTYLLRYVSDVPATLRELARVLRPGGVMLSQDFAVPRGVFYPLWRLHTDLVLRLVGALISPGWRRAGAFLGGSIRDFYRRWPEDRIVDLWRECGFPDVRAKRLSLGGALIMWGTRAS
jgi:demethylmenaquinone methyltransferase/2-methoxy-6-polyprenyl-1,4-benzoquinol methylase